MQGGAAVVGVSAMRRRLRVTRPNENAINALSERRGMLEQVFCVDNVLVRGLCGASERHRGCSHRLFCFRYALDGGRSLIARFAD